MRVQIDEGQVNPRRFRIAENEMGGAILNWEGLKKVKIANMVSHRDQQMIRIEYSHNGLSSEEKHSYVVRFRDPGFRIEQYLNEEIVMIVNH